MELKHATMRVLRDLFLVAVSAMPFAYMLEKQLVPAGEAGVTTT